MPNASFIKGGAMDRAYEEDYTAMQTEPRHQAQWSARIFFLALITRAACDPVFEALKGITGEGMGLGAIVNALMTAIAAWYILRRPNAIIPVVAPMWAPFLLVAAISVTVAPSFSHSIRLCLVQFSYCAVFAIPFYLLRSRRAVRQCLFAILWSSLLPACLGIFQVAVPSARFEGEGSRIHATFSHPNIFAFYLTLVISTILYMQKAAVTLLRPATRTALWLYMLVLVVLLVHTKTRSAWVGMLLVFCIYGFFFQRRYLVYVLLAPAILLLDTDVRERLADLGSNNDSPMDGNVNSYQWRVILWTAGLNWMDSSRKLLGYGLDSFKIYSTQFFPLEGRDTWDPHNVYVQLYFETGIAGVASYFWIFFKLLRQLGKVFTRDRPGGIILIATTLCYLVTSWTDNMMYYLSFNWYFWFLMGTVCAAYRRIDDETGRQPGS
jgi:O-antigen ligase